MKAITDENYMMLHLYKAGKYITLVEENGEVIAYEISIGVPHPKDYPTRSRVLMKSNAGDFGIGAKATEKAYNDLKTKTL